MWIYPLFELDIDIWSKCYFSCGHSEKFLFLIENYASSVDIDGPTTT